MRRTNRYHYMIGMALAFSLWQAKAQIADNWRNPMDHPMSLAGNFAELRPNHFHAGIDMKTQGTTGKAIHAPKEGYVARISASPWGYGYALYLNHPDGITTVYGHLERFVPKLADYLQSEQRRQERFAVDLVMTPDQFPVKEGEIVAYSGNTGGSGGPHVHFEMRETSTDTLFDPLLCYQHLVKDTRAPKIHGLLVVPQEGVGIVNGKSEAQEIEVTTDKQGRPLVKAKIEAWGEIGLGIRANDYMDGTSNVYGVKEIILKQGDNELFHSDITGLQFSDNHYINAWTDYDLWVRKRLFYQKCFVEPGNRLAFILSEGRGLITIDEEKPYPFTFILSDLYGNKTTLQLTIVGKRQEIPPLETEGREHLHWNSVNRFGAKGVRLEIPRGNLYADVYLHYSVHEIADSPSDMHTLHDKVVPLHEKAQLSLRIKGDTLPNKRQYGAIRWRGSKRSWIGGKYRNGWIDASITELGTYSLAIDSVAPFITPVQPSQWMAKKTFTFQLGDNLSGVEYYRGTIDGKYSLFRMDNHSVIRCSIAEEKLEHGPHTLLVEVIDACGNRSEYTHDFNW